jgi:hypothetical protein
MSNVFKFKSKGGGVFLSSLLVIGWVVGCFPIKNPLQSPIIREHKFLSLVGVIAAVQLFAAIGSSAIYMLYNPGLYEIGKVSEFLLSLVFLVVYHVMGNLRRVLSLVYSSEIIHIINVCRSNPRSPADRSILALTLFTSTIYALRRVSSFLSIYLFPNLVKWPRTGIDSIDMMVRPCTAYVDIMVGFSTFFILCLTVLMGLQIMYRFA